MPKQIHIHPVQCLKVAKYKIQKPSTCRATLFCCKFWIDVSLFHPAWSTCRATNIFVVSWIKLLSEVEQGSSLSNTLWLCCSFFIKLATWLRSTPCKSIKQRAALLQPAANAFVAGQVDQARWKVQNIDPKLATKQCCARSSGLLYLVFHLL